MKQLSVIHRLRGSILLYVLWMLVIISLLAFQLSSVSRALLINQVSETNLIKKNLQLYSATQFAKFKILSNDWKNLKFDLKINNQAIFIEIFNESGFFSLYNLSNQSLKNILNSINIEQSVVEKINFSDEGSARFNDFYELTQYEGINEETLYELIPFVSIYHEEAINPALAPAEVLMRISGVDQYRVNKLMESNDEPEKDQLRREIVEILKSHNTEVSENSSEYYRVHISFGTELYRIFLKYNRRNKDFLVVNTLSPLSPQI